MAGRTGISTAEVDGAIYQVVNAYDVIGVRQLFYQLVSLGFPKTESMYKRIIDRVVKMRKSGSIPWHKIEDGGRAPVIWDTSSIEEKVRRLGNVNVDYWANQPFPVEVWIEKAGLVGVVRQTCADFRAPVMATRGYPSWSCLFQAADRACRDGRDLTILYCGDYDASGMGISDDLESNLNEAVDIVYEETGYEERPWITVHRIALTKDQIATYDLPERPHKATDSRTAGFVARTGATGAVELDALDPDALNTIIRSSLNWNIKDKGALHEAKLQEEVERAVAAEVAASAGDIVSSIRQRLAL
jgi:hypothetical protein